VSINSSPRDLLLLWSLTKAKRVSQEHSEHIHNMTHISCRHYQRFRSWQCRTRLMFSTRTELWNVSYPILATTTPQRYQT
jgi:hypothetical protein